MDREKFEKVLAIRKEVLGEEWVERSLANLDDFTRDFQEDFITATCWGGVWGREGLTRKQRSLLNLGMLAALGRMHEFDGHVRGALNNGITRIELREALMQIGVYCGAPAGISSEERRVGKAFVSTCRSWCAPDH